MDFRFDPAVHTDPVKKARLLTLLKELSYVEGEVTLASGKKSDFYIDCRQTSLHPEGAALIGEIWAAWTVALPFAPGGAGGMTMGADPLATALSVKLFERGVHCPAFIVRKEAKTHGAGKRIEGRRSIPDGSEVLMLEDVVTTGGSTIKAADAVREDGLAPRAVFCLVDRLEGGREALTAAGLPLFSIFTRRDFKG